MSAMHEGIQALEEVGEVLLDCITNSNAEKTVKTAMEKQTLILSRLLETRKSAAQLVSDLLHTEEKVAHDLLDIQSQRNGVLEELDKLEKELQKSKSRKDMLQAEIEFLQKEIDSLREAEREVQVLQAEVDEDTTEIIPSTKYIVQLYHKVTKIKWDFNTEPDILRGVHFGKDIVTPINLDTREHSEGFISDYLWSLVSTEW
ncbi:kinetochore protein Spc24 [Lepisosteus oculatus]|nr:PREDICTED: kinetochore protein Spc24 [Lepisosteus oculatus]XP_015204397.1 PREDICTED: kinetochore protein Spc24 [Lepisosteus oculatus]